MNTAIVTAAGQGIRFGGRKALHRLKDRTLLAWALSNFEKAENVGEIIVTIPSDDTDETYRRIFAAEKFHKVRLVKGGETRYESVRNAFEALKTPGGIILIHDAARPLVSMDLIERVTHTAEQYGAAIPILPINETVKEVEGGQVLRTIPRERLFLAQTPQAFRAGILKDAYSKITDKSVTDEAMLVELAGHMVHVVDGEPRNMKITTAFDLRIAECWI